MTTPPPVRAAGCVLWRAGRSGLEVCLVHRPRYDDWSHPKGKLKRGENALAGAVREVLEETGHHCVPGVPLPTIRYEAKGRPKEVAYWAAEAVDGTFTPSPEVDRVAWLTPRAAERLLTYPHDRRLIAALLASRAPGQAP
ncbi:NUDIX hydrolase [Streptomyces sp. NPDC047928]|uniref:NUDIX hydrolase n=1 Tax=unclassified Streptomyces TaxID=2593676 RepID=UPI003719764E